MPMRLPLRLFLILCLTALPIPARADTPPSFADLVEKLSPAVVNVSTEQKIKGAAPNMMAPFPELPDTPEFEPFRQFFDQLNHNQHGQPVEREVYSLGSGFIIDPSGYVVTNNHVIDDAEDITVTLADNTKYKAKIVGRDKKGDLALLKIESKKPLPFVVMGDSDAMRVGDWVIAIGNPYGLGGTVTQGIISARQRSLNAGPFDDFLQTDASINRGNSGGPLFNTKGEVIGIATAIFSPSGGSIGIGFAIPTAVAKPVIEQLKQFGRTHRGWLGVKIQEVSDEAAESVGLPRAMGALVLDVNKGSPADKAGIKPGDIITAYNGKDITEMRFLPRLVAETKIGSTVPVTLWRKNAAQTVQVTIGELDETAEQAESGGKGKKSKGKAEGEAMLGMQLAPLTPALREEYNIADDVTGLIVTDVAEDSDAANYGVQPGDVVAEVNSAPVATVDDLRKAFAAARKAGRKYALVKIIGDHEIAFVTLPTAEEKKP